MIYKPIKFKKILSLESFVQAEIQKKKKFKKSKNTTIKSEGEREAEIHKKKFKKSRNTTIKSEGERIVRSGEVTWVAARPGSCAAWDARYLGCMWPRSRAAYVACNPVSECPRSHTTQVALRQRSRCDLARCLGSSLMFWVLQFFFSLSLVLL